MVLDVWVVVEGHVPALRSFKAMFLGFSSNYFSFLGISEHLEILVVGDPRIFGREVLLHDVAGTAGRRIVGDPHIAKDV